MKFEYLAILMSLTACGPKKEVPMSPEETPEQLVQDKYTEVAARFPRFLDRGFVVSLKDGAPQHQGDSLIFSGLALYALDCPNGQPIADAFLKMLDELDGGVYRHPDQAEREPSLDGLLGFYRGVAKRISCGETDLWAKAMKNHRARTASNVPAEFNLVSDALGYKLGLNAEPDMKRLHFLAVEVASWAHLVKASKAACYRIHLGLLALQTLQDMGYPISGEDRGGWANATDGVQMAAVDQFAGRGGMSDFLASFTYNEWQYKHQRCPIWEKPDGEGMEHPAVDFLVGYSDLHGAPK